MLSIQKESQAQAMYDLSMNLKRLGIDTSSGPEPMSDTEVIVGSFALGIGAAGLFLGGVGTSAPVVINTVLKSGEICMKAGEILTRYLFTKQNENDPDWKKSNEMMRELEKNDPGLRVNGIVKKMEAMKEVLMGGGEAGSYAYGIISTNDPKSTKDLLLSIGTVLSHILKVF